MEGRIQEVQITILIVRASILTSVFFSMTNEDLDPELGIFTALNFKQQGHLNHWTEGNRKWYHTMIHMHPKSSVCSLFHPVLRHPRGPEEETVFGVACLHLADLELCAHFSNTQ